MASNIKSGAGCAAPYVGVVVGGATGRPDPFPCATAHRMAVAVDVRWRRGPRSQNICQLQHSEHTGKEQGDAQTKLYPRN